MACKSSHLNYAFFVISWNSPVVPPVVFFFIDSHHYYYSIPDTPLVMQGNLSCSRKLVCVLPCHNLLSVVARMCLVLLFPPAFGDFCNNTLLCFFLFLVSLLSPRLLKSFFLNLYLLFSHVGGFLQILNSC